MANTVYYSESYKGPQLLVVWQGTIRALSLGGEMTLGRRTPENVVDIPVDASFVSRSHGKFICDEQGCFYVDTKSMNGTYYNGCAVYPDTPDKPEGAGSAGKRRNRTRPSARASFQRRSSY